MNKSYKTREKINDMKQIFSTPNEKERKAKTPNR
jgi:hypothetical protein